MNRDGWDTVRTVGVNQVRPCPQLSADKVNFKMFLRLASTQGDTWRIGVVQMERWIAMTPVFLLVEVRCLNNNKNITPYNI